MSTLLMVSLLCYVYIVLAMGLLSQAISREGTSLTFLFGVPLLITLAIYFIGGGEMLRTVAFFPLRLLASLLR